MLEPRALSINCKNVENKAESIEKRKGKNSSKMLDTIEAKRTRGNYFAPLSDDSDDCDESIVQHFKKHVHNYKNKTNNASTSSANQNKIYQKEKVQRETNKTTNNDLPNTIIKKIPPINICEIETKELISFLKHGFKKND